MHKVSRVRSSTEHAPREKRKPTIRMSSAVQCAFLDYHLSTQTTIQCNDALCCRASRNRERTLSLHPSLASVSALIRAVTWPPVGTRRVVELTLMPSPLNKSPVLSTRQTMAGRDLIATALLMATVRMPNFLNHIRRFSV